MAKEVCLCTESRTLLAAATNFSKERRTANYSPNSWDYSSFAIATAQYNHEKEEISDYCEEMKGSIRSLLYEESQLSATKLNLIDMLRWLGVAYHFSEEIKCVLEEMDAKDASKNDDVACLILLFRLMRENCYEVPQDIFNKIITSVRENPQYDVETLISLYEASFLAFAGEKLLHEVTEFSKKQLKQLRRTSMDQNLKRQLDHALEMPLHWRVPRLEIRRTIDQCQRDENVYPPLITLAKLEYNQVQLVHQGELSRLLKWWIELGLKEKLPFARDRFVESFFIAAGIVPEQYNADCRETLAKLAILMVVLDDVYDVYATFDELLLFNEAIYRWDDDDQATKGLPEYMKALYSVILNTTKETISYVQAKYGWDASPLLIKAWQDVCCSFLSEAKWYHTNYKPSFEEYLENGWMSSTAPLLLTHALTMLSDRATTQELNVQRTYPRLVQSCATVLRLINDLATHHAEVERGDAPSSIACFMREQSCTERCASKAIEELIMETWKKINEESMMSHGHDHHGLPRPFVDACVNLARVSLCVYSGGDGVGVPDQRKKDLIRSLLFDPISMDYLG